MDMRRLFLFLIFSFSLVVLWSAWVRQNEPVVPAGRPVAANPSVPTDIARPAHPATAPATVEAQKAPAGKNIVVKTDTFKVEINTAGGNIQHLELLQHKDADDQSKPFTLLQQHGSHTD